MGLDPAARVERQIITQNRFIFDYFGTEEAHVADQAQATPSPPLSRIPQALTSQQP
jgi:trehalose-6-phosphatase